MAQLINTLSTLRLVRLPHIPTASSGRVMWLQKDEGTMTHDAEQGGAGRLISMRPQIYTKVQVGLKL
jgi:hypothetical protein